MIVAAILIGLCEFLGFVGLYILFTRWAERKEAQIRAEIDQQLKLWFVPEAEGQPHRAAQLLGSMGDIIGRSAAHSIMATFSAERSHVARAANAALAEAEAQQNPLLNLLSGGRRGKGAAIAQLAQLLAPMIRSVGSGNGDTGSVLERLRKGG